MIYEYKGPDFCGPAFVAKPFGPEYPRELGKDAAGFRKFARHGLNELSMMSRRGYGNAVLEAIRGKQRSELRRAAVPISRPNCASGTFEQTGKDILKAVTAQNRPAWLGAGPWTPANQKRADQTYAAAMVAKRGVDAAAVLENVGWCKAA